MPRHENHTEKDFSSHPKTVVAGMEVAARRSLKWKVTGQIGVHTIPDTVTKASRYNVNIALRS